MDGLASLGRRRETPISRPVRSLSRSTPERLAMQFDDIDWEHWKPQQHATLLFVLRDHHVLLIDKKRGIGAGKVNGPGGRIDDGESALGAAIREVQEELLVTPTGVSPVGEVLFQVVDGTSIHIHVFCATGCEGEPQETDVPRRAGHPSTPSRSTRCGKTTGSGSRTCSRGAGSRHARCSTVTR